jgi:3-deoxy-D-manno-octulosonate 8-phosphate phosphatase (KDO 8-P phosphatase)
LLIDEENIFINMSKIKLPKSIKMVITDFDGVVTDNCVYINEDFSMSRKLNFKDVMGFSILKKNGYDIAIISGEANSAIEIMAKKFGITEIHQKIRTKIDVLKSIIDKYNLTQDNYVYLGDDINDLECLKFAKYKITVPHAVKKVKDVEGIQITSSSAGDGAFREVADCLVG